MTSTFSSDADRGLPDSGAAEAAVPWETSGGIESPAAEPYLSAEDEARAESALSDQREKLLVEAAVNGDQRAIEALYLAHYDTVFRYLLLRSGSHSLAEDLTSQVFLAMVRGLPQFKWQGKPFLAWLYAIAQKQIAMHYRGRSRQPSAVELDEAAELIADTAGPDAGVEQRERRLRLAAALRMLPDTQREVVMLRFVLSLPLSETAAVIGKSEGAVKQLQMRALSSLRDLLGGESPSEI